jgi:hypothetical protein
MELLMCVEAAADAGRGAMDPIDATNRERQRTTQFGDGKTPTGVAALRDIDELNEGRGHRPWAMIVRRY